MKTADDRMVEQLVARVISRLAVKLGANGRKGSILAVFCGATVGVPTALAQVRSLVWHGYRVHTVFTAAASTLYGNQAAWQWDGLPHIEPVAPDEWLQRLNEAAGVIVPVLSVNTLTKITLLLADNVATNVVVHALFMGKPVVAAVDGVDPQGSGRSRLGFNRGTPALEQALRTRLDHVKQYGCMVVGAERVGETLRQRLGTTRLRETTSSPNPVPQRGLSLTGAVVSVAQVAHARRNGVRVLHIPEKALVTPLARETAASHGIRFRRTTPTAKAL